MGCKKVTASLYNAVLKKPKTLNKFGSQIVGMVRKFDDWWNTVPADLKQKARKGDESNKPLLNQINYVLLHLHLAGKHDAKPTHDELKDWLHSGQVDVLRMNK
jgi:phosphomevalonate kinase